MGYEYLGSPYSGTTAEQELRHRQAEEAVALLLKTQRWIYSPIVHCHALAQNHGLPTDFTFWMHYDHAMLAASKGMIVLTLDGWEASRGLKGEIGYARNRNIPIVYMSLEEIRRALPT